MAQADYNIAPSPSGLNLRTEVNTIFSAILSNNSGSTAPTVTSAFMLWVDTSNATYYYLKMRNHDNTAWVTLGTYTVATKTYISYIDGDQTISGIKTFGSFPVTPSSAPTTNYQVANKKYVDDNIGSLKTIASGTATFTATTNNINLTGIGVGVEIGDVIQISGANDAKNNSDFTIEVITDANNVIVNQAHANKGTSKNVAARSGDTGVTVQLLAKWYSATAGLGQDWVDVTSSRNTSTTYTNNTNREIFIAYTTTQIGTGSTTMSINGTLAVAGSQSNISGQVNITLPISKANTYLAGGTNTKLYWWEKR